MKRINLKTMLSAIGLLVVVTPSALSVVACGAKPIVEGDRTNLVNVIKERLVDGKVANSTNAVLAKVGELNPNLVLRDVEIGNFKAATETTNGSATVVAKSNTQYTGAVSITITALAQIDLRDVIKNTEVQGNTANTENAVLVEVAKLNSGLQVAYVEIEGFEAATETTDGLGTIIAKSDTKYTGEVAITIKKLGPLALIDVIKNTRVEGEFANDADAVLTEVGKLNSELTLQDVELKDFKAAVKDKNGSANIVAKSDTKYIGEVTIIITLNQEYIVNAINNY